MSKKFIDDYLPELKKIEYLIDTYSEQLSAEEIASISHKSTTLPIYALKLGNPDPNLPALCFVGGVHGLERIGSQVVIAFLESLLGRLAWDISLKYLLDHISVYFIPLLNPVGVALHKRSNGNGVDLMRNAKIESHEKTAFLVGGHRLSPKMPWFMGKQNTDMEIETKALINFIQQQCFSRKFSLVLDCHSGFGLHDRIWFPYAKSKLQPIHHIGEIYHIRDLLFQAYPYQNYIFEPQSLHYLCHGDIWDYLYDESLKHSTTFLPLTLEMGSWRWVRKNPTQLIKSLGLFHPIKPHRVKRVLRAHLVLMEFLMRVSASSDLWLEDGKSLNMAHKATELWYHN
ncbi:DUF2817 domain-containing protein [Catenovulum sp. 2E275]|uniref:M14 family zinc carboxypeptidase n=1 Tax=Catenovulum sp. 2E275 TaxID=2980497 RepID=UPI0021CDEFD3|nr:M14 family zinc carboxypeptidase [Catenovulum sp. 2E275]MCU4677359.1 DUF2817 domain-containing protein [Catenovulum sp. 2E275]